MSYDWYKVVNREEFEAESLVSRELTLILEGIGQVTVMVFKGNVFSIVYNDVQLSNQITDENPFVFDGYAIFEDPETTDVYLGIPVA